MKKIIVLLCAFCLCGCARLSSLSPEESEKKEEQKAEENVTLQCTKGEESVTLDATGDKVSHCVQVLFLSFEDLGVDKETVDPEKLSQAVQKAVEKKYNGIEGVSAESSVEEERVRIAITIDYDVADLNALVEAKLLNKNDVQVHYMSLDATQKDLEKQGYACSVQ